MLTCHVRVTRNRRGWLIGHKAFVHLADLKKHLGHVNAATIEIEHGLHSRHYHVRRNSVNQVYLYPVGPPNEAADKHGSQL